MTVNTVGIEVPLDFPTATYNEFHEKISPLQPKHSEAYKHYAGGWNAVAYRFASAADYDREFTRSIQTSTCVTERNIQEHSLFGFFMSGVAVLDSAAYALYAVAYMIAPGKFLLTELHRIAFSSVAVSFATHFSADPLASTLKAISENPEMIQLREIRNVLGHRASTTRAFGPSATGIWELRHHHLSSRL